MITNSDKTWLNNAEKLLKEHNSFGRYNMIALVVKGNRILSIGKNYYEQRRGGKTLNKKYIRGMHAELHALIESSCERGTMYIIGRTKRNLICSKPCEHCTTLLKNSRIKNIVFYDETLALIKVKANEL